MTVKILNDQRMGKRGKAKIKGGSTLEDAYSLLNEHFGVKIDHKRYKTIVYAVNKRIMEGVRNGEEFTMPYRLGSIRVKKQKVNLNNLRIDFKYFNETGIKKKYLNEHTGGYYFFYKWAKTLADVKNKYYYTFFPTRANKKSLVGLLKSGEMTKRDYYE
jgi:hypothetical protein